MDLAARRALITRRHHLAGGATTPEQVTAAVLALHATDPGSVVLQVLARGHRIAIPDVLAAMYERRSMVRWMAMRRTLFVFPRDLVPTVQAAVSTPLAAALRRRLVSRITRNGSDPAVDGDVGAWLTAIESDVELALEARGSATGAQLGSDVPALRTVIRPGAPSEVPQNMTSPFLVVMSAEGRMVRGTAIGAWTARAHRWEPLAHWWPDGMPHVPTADAQVDLARTWLRAFGPATDDDLEWWTGWTKTATRAALARLRLREVDLDGEPGIALDEDDPLRGLPAPDPVATLLPALDPTAMGWKHRGWYMGVDPARIFDRAGNIGPSIWWDGEIVGGWAIGADGSVRTAVLADRGQAAVDAVDAAAALLQDRLDGVVVTPAARTPLERELSA